MGGQINQVICESWHSLLKLNTYLTNNKAVLIPDIYLVKMSSNIYLKYTKNVHTALLTMNKTCEKSEFLWERDGVYSYKKKFCVAIKINIL